MSRSKCARADAQERDAIAVVGIHVRLDLEDEAGEAASRRGSIAPARRLARAGAAARARGSASRNGCTPKLVSALPKNIGVWPPAQHRVGDRRSRPRRRAARARREPSARRRSSSGSRTSDRRAARRYRRAVLAARGTLEQMRLRAMPVVDAVELAARCRSASSPGTASMPSTSSISSSRSSGSRAGRSHLVHEREDRDARAGGRPRRACASAPRCPSPASISITAAVGGGQHAVGVLARSPCGRACRAG